MPLMMAIEEIEYGNEILNSLSLLRAVAYIPSFYTRVIL